MRALETATVTAAVLVVLCSACRHTGEFPRRIDRAPEPEPVAVSQARWWRAFGSAELESVVAALHDYQIPDSLDLAAVLPDQNHWVAWQHALFGEDMPVPAHQAAAWRAGARLTIENDAALALLRCQTTDAQIRALSAWLASVAPDYPGREEKERLLNALSRRSVRQRRALKQIAGVSAGGDRVTGFVSAPAPPVRVNASLLMRRPDVVSAEAALLREFRLPSGENSVQIPSVSLSPEADLQRWQQELLVQVHFPILDPADRRRFGIDATRQAVVRERYLHTLARALSGVHAAVANARERHDMSQALPPANASVDQQLRQMDLRLSAARAALILRAELGGEW